MHLVVQLLLQALRLITLQYCLMIAVLEAGLELANEGHRTLDVSLIASFPKLDDGLLVNYLTKRISSCLLLAQSGIEARDRFWVQQARGCLGILAGRDDTAVEIRCLRADEGRQLVGRSLGLGNAIFR